MTETVVKGTSRKGSVFITLILLLGMMMTAGCVTEQSLYRGLEERRAQAYVTWKQAREKEKEARVLLRGELSLEDSLKFALSNNKSLQAAAQEREISRGVVLESYGSVLPTITGTADYVRLDETASFNVGGQSVSLGDVNNYSAGLQVSQPLFRGGAIPAALRSAKWVSLLASEQVRGVVHGVIYDVASAYYNTLLGQHLYEVNRDAVISAKAYLKDVTVKRDQGLASDFDVLRAQVDVSLFEAQMIQQRNRVNLSRTRLFRAMGISQDSKVVLSDSLHYAPVRPVFDEAVRIAYDKRADLYQVELSVKLQQEALRVARSQYWPKLDAFLRQEWAKPDPHTSTKNDWGDAWSAGLSAVWPLFDGLQREGRIRQERERLKQKEITLIDTQEQALLEVRQAILSLRDGEEFVESQKLNLARAREALRLAEVQYREGVAEAVATTEARSALTRAQGLYYEAVFNHTIARLALQRSMGILGPGFGEHEDDHRSPILPGVIGPFEVKQSENAGETGLREEASKGGS
ncbi:MAG: TolC family protein [Desulfatiglans sp.]|jgi:outer membrane protein TolC|nr:TolC family protein [Thermodesulfobacteriota bacterium]MEE4354193.1 TolC family protein [Desulfatiglans sp.]